MKAVSNVVPQQGGSEQEMRSAAPSGQAPDAGTDSITSTQKENPHVIGCPEQHFGDLRTE